MKVKQVRFGLTPDEKLRVDRQISEKRVETLVFADIEYIVGAAGVVCMQDTAETLAETLAKAGLGSGGRFASDEGALYFPYQSIEYTSQYGLNFAILTGFGGELTIASRSPIERSEDDIG